MQFIRFNIGPNHRWIGRTIKNLIVPPETLFVLLIRGKENIIPKGDTLILEGDTLVLSAQGVEDKTKFLLSEIEIDDTHEWLGHSLANIEMDTDKIIMAIKRGDEFIIPNGQTIIELSDIVLINKILVHN